MDQKFELNLVKRFRHTYIQLPHNNFVMQEFSFPSNFRHLRYKAISGRRAAHGSRRYKAENLHESS